MCNKAKVRRPEEQQTYRNVGFLRCRFCRHGLTEIVIIPQKCDLLEDTFYLWTELIMMLNQATGCMTVTGCVGEE